MGPEHSLRTRANDSLRSTKTLALFVAVGSSALQREYLQSTSR
jgi:hypothetical protein